MSSTMTLPEIAQVAFGTVAAVVALTLFVAWRILRKMKKEIEDAAVLDREARADKRREEPDYKTLYLEECRKREEVFRMVEIAQRERDRWKDIFWQCSGEHGVAQEFMLRINQHFARLLKRNPDAQMPAIRKAFEERYGEKGKLQIVERISGGLPGLPTPEELAAAAQAPAVEPSFDSGALPGDLETPDHRIAPVAKFDPNA